MQKAALITFLLLAVFGTALWSKRDASSQSLIPGDPTFQTQLQDKSAMPDVRALESPILEQAASEQTQTSKEPSSDAIEDTQVADSPVSDGMGNFDTSFETSFEMQYESEKTSLETITSPTWLDGVLITEYYPALESNFKGEKVSVPGLATKHRIDWLYSATGVSMEGDGIGEDGKKYHIDNLGQGGWINKSGDKTIPSESGWSSGPPYWRVGGFYLNAKGLPTFRFQNGAWSNKTGIKYVKPPKNITFKQGSSRPLRAYRSVAVDPDLIPLGSQIYIPAYKSAPNGGWFIAEDVGGAIIGKHLDVYINPPKDGKANTYEDQRIRVLPPPRKL